MSKIFYDHLITLEEVDIEIRAISQTPDEKEELWKLIDEIVNHRMMITILESSNLKNLLDQQTYLLILTGSCANPQH